MLIDFRARPDTEEYVDLLAPPSDLKWRRWGVDRPTPRPLDDFTARLRDLGVDHGVFTGRQSTTNGKRTFGLSNDYVAECSAHSGGTLIGVAGIDISDQAFAVQETERAILQLGLKGISIDPKRAGVHISDKRVFPIYERAQDLGVPIIITMGPFVAEYGDPITLDAAAAAFPRANFICSHGCWPYADQYVALAYRRQNVFIEPSIYWNLPGAGVSLEAANGLLQDQFVYASAYPFARLDTYKMLETAIDWDPKAWEKFTHTNAARLLGLD